MEKSLSFITSSDEHYAPFAPGFCTPSYGDDILEMLEWQGQLARKTSAEAVVRAGDLIHSKNPAHMPMRSLASIARIHRKYGCDTLAIAGNHDMKHNDPTSISSQPLGVLFESGVLQQFTEKTFEFGTVKTRLIGVEYTTDLDVDGLQSLVKKKDENYTVAFVHALAAFSPEEKIQAFFNERIFDYRDLVFEGCPDVYVFGHYHKDQGIVEHQGVKFVNLGAIARGALTIENLERKPKVSHIKITSSGVSVEEIVVPHKDASEVFDLEKKKRIDLQMKDMRDFIDKLQANTDMASGGGLKERLATLDSVPNDLREMVLETLEQADSGDLKDL